MVPYSGGARRPEYAGWLEMLLWRLLACCTTLSTVSVGRHEPRRYKHALEAVVPPAKGQRLLFFYYGFYLNSSGGFAAEPMLQVIVPGVENVMVVSNPTSQEKARAWGEHGGAFALHLPRDNRSYSLSAYLGQGNTTEGVQIAASHFEQWLQQTPFNQTLTQPFE